jgi:hypothetical protein
MSPFKISVLGAVLVLSLPIMSAQAAVRGEVSLKNITISVDDLDVFDGIQAASSPLPKICYRIPRTETP